MTWDEATRWIEALRGAAAMRTSAAERIGVWHPTMSAWYPTRAVWTHEIQYGIPSIGPGSGWYTRRRR